jgi:hypothetical protein
MPNQNKPQDSYQEDTNAKSMDGKKAKSKEANATRHSKDNQEKAKAGQPNQTNAIVGGLAKAGGFSRRIHVPNPLLI